MPKARKTLNVTDTVATLNGYIQYADTAEARLAICSVIERILHDSGRYRGFRYTNLVEVYEYNGEITLDSPDESFRHYFVSDS